MSDLSSALTEDMVEKAAHSLAAREGYDWDEVSQHWQRIYRDRAEDVLEAALGSRVVLDLPEPIQRNERGATWQVKVDGNTTEFDAHLHWDDNSPVVETDFALWDPDELEAYCLAGLAAAREARRLAAGCAAHGRHPHDGMRCLDCPEWVTGAGPLAAEGGEPHAT